MSYNYRRCFFEGYKFREWTKNGIRENCFHESTLVSSLQSEIRVTIEFLLMLGETNFVKVPSPCTKSVKILGLEKAPL